LLHPLPAAIQKKMAFPPDNWQKMRALPDGPLPPARERLV
jgi:hypothetical protein